MLLACTDCIEHNIIVSLLIFLKIIILCLCRQNSNRVSVTSNTNISNYGPNGRVELRVNYLAIISFSMKD